MTITDQTERNILGGGLIALGGSLGGAAAALGALSFSHMMASANVCGPNAGHCLTCIGALACLAGAFAAAGAGLSLLRPLRPGVVAARNMQS